MTSAIRSADRGPFTRGQLRSKWLTTPTARQLEVLAYVRDYAAFHGYPPTFREIAAAHGIRSTQGATDHIRALCRKGLLSMVKGASRTMAITKAGRALLAGGLSHAHECGNLSRDPKPAAESRRADEPEGR